MQDPANYNKNNTSGNDGSDVDAFAALALPLIIFAAISLYLRN